MAKTSKPFDSYFFGGLMAALAAACASEVKEPSSSPEVIAANPTASSSSGSASETRSTPVAENPAGTGETTTVPIDNSVGGAVALSDGTSIAIPPGALPAGVTSITVTSQQTAAPAEYTTFAPLFKFEPDGTVFEKPLKVSFPVVLPSGVTTSAATVLWSRPAGQPGFDMVPTTFTPVNAAEGRYMATAEVTHFSEGTCGLKYSTDPHPAADPYGD